MRNERELYRIRLVHLDWDDRTMRERALKNLIENFEALVLCLQFQSAIAGACTSFQALRQSPATYKLVEVLIV
jgi:hypothetical protein